MEAALKKRNLQIAEETAEEAKLNAPVKTGALRDSIHVVVNEHTGDARVEVGVPYGAAVELGHHQGGIYIPAHPYMSPATEHVRHKYRHKPLRINL